MLRLIIVKVSVLAGGGISLYIYIYIYILKYVNLLIHLNGLINVNLRVNNLSVPGVRRVNTSRPYTAVPWNDFVCRGDQPDKINVVVKGGPIHRKSPRF